jgi:hypothetical protein
MTWMCHSPELFPTLAKGVLLCLSYSNGHKVNKRGSDTDTFHLLRGRSACLAFYPFHLAVIA